MLNLLPFLLASAFAAPAAETPIPISEHTIPFVAKIVNSTRSEAKQAAFNLLREKATGKKIESKRWGPTSGSLTIASGGGEYAVPISIGSQSFLVAVDTGSSDLWVAATNYDCQASFGTCYQGVTLYDPSKHPGFKPLPFKSNFAPVYGGGEVTGYAGYETVKLGSLTVPLTEFGVATAGTEQGDGISSGILGLASPALTSVFFGTDPNNDDYKKNLAPYPPWFYTAVAEFQVAPYFSLLLQRPTYDQENGHAPISNFGSLTLGGVPNVPTTTSVTVQNAFIKTNIDGVTTYVPQQYQVQVDSVNFKGNKGLNTKIPQVILDSGTTLTNLPEAIVTAFYANYPGGASQPFGYQYLVDCNPPGGAPSLSFTIGGKTFTLQAADLVVPSFFPPNPKTGLTQCFGTVVSGGTDQQNDIFILGVKFLSNVVTTYNILTNQITIAQRSS